MQEQVFWQTCEPMGHPHGNSMFLKNYAQWKGPMLEQFMDDFVSLEGPHDGAEKECEEEGEGEMKSYELN